MFRRSIKTSDTAAADKNAAREEVSRTERNTHTPHDVTYTTVDVTLIQPQKAGQCCLTPSEEQKEKKKSWALLSLPPQPLRTPFHALRKGERRNQLVFLRVGFVARREYRKFIPTLKVEESRREPRKKWAKKVWRPQEEEGTKIRSRKVSTATERECEKRRAAEEGNHSILLERKGRRELREEE